MAFVSIIDRFDPRVETERGLLSQALAEGLSYRSGIVASYEAALAKIFGAGYALATSSGFGALVVAFAALGLQPGDKVILTPTCPLCTAYALSFLRLVPVFCDIRSNDFSLDLEMAERRFDERTSAILDIPMWGYPVPAESVAAFARSKRVPYVLDLALSHMARFNGRLLSSYADIATFSTHASKAFVTGEGGAVLTDDAALAERARSFIYPDNPAVTDPSLNYGLCGLQAALGLARLPRLEADIAARLDRMAQIVAGLDNPHIEPLPVCPGGTPSGTKLIIRERSGDNRNLMAHLAAMGIPSDIATYDCRPLYQYSVYAAFAAPCPNAERMLASITTLPVHPDIDVTQIQQIVSTLNTYRPSRT
jgi:perosamine synthetase